MKSGELTAGQFANLSGLTKADLAQFDRIDLFSPAKRAKKMVQPPIRLNSYLF
ncbi:hypothetical protein [Secundilactobacillus oryzae]|uniref:hypothetical protein n=1 Tax=Secundilactobacillus oryzae TaxID=1202668 RepID=UPI000A85FACE|nr:hypothetical protein [Secundilactobacillus oryzae]